MTGTHPPVTLRACSLARPTVHWLEQVRSGGQSARVLAVFGRACDLVTDDGSVAALVSDSIGDGPLNIVIEGMFGCLARGVTRSVRWGASRSTECGSAASILRSDLWGRCVGWLCHGNGLVERRAFPS